MILREIIRDSLSANPYRITLLDETKLGGKNLLDYLFYLKRRALEVLHFQNQLCNKKEHFSMRKPMEMYEKVLDIH